MSLGTPVIASSSPSYSAPIAAFVQDPPDVIEINDATVGNAPNMAMDGVENIAFDLSGGIFTRRGRKVRDVEIDSGVTSIHPVHDFKTASAC